MQKSTKGHSNTTPHSTLKTSVTKKGKENTTESSTPPSMSEDVEQDDNNAVRLRPGKSKKKGQMDKPGSKKNKKNGKNHDKPGKKLDKPGKKKNKSKKADKPGSKPGKKMDKPGSKSRISGSKPGGKLHRPGKPGSKKGTKTTKKPKRGNSKKSRKTTPAASNDMHSEPTMDGSDTHHSDSSLTTPSDASEVPLSAAPNKKPKKKPGAPGSRKGKG